METLGFILSIFIGISLGLMGGGGAILTVPLLVYFFNLDPLLASASALAIVGFTSIIGLIPRIRIQEVSYSAWLNFGVPSMLSVWMVRKWLLPLVPDPIVLSENLQFARSSSFMVLFSALIVWVAFSMLRSKALKPSIEKVKSKKSLVVLGILTGIIAGFFGAGGGFLIIPALLSTGSFSINRAVGTSLLIITSQSTIGFFSDAAFSEIPFTLLAKISVITAVGSLFGASLGRKLSANQLKIVFAWFLMCVGSIIFLKELLFA